MQFTIRHRADWTPEAWIVPVAKQENLEAVLAPVAEQTQVPLELIKADFQAAAKEVHTLYFTENQRARRVFLLGLGEKPGMPELTAAFRSFAFKRKTHLPAELGISFPDNNFKLSIPAAVEAAVNGLMLGLYDIGLYKTEEKKQAEKPVADAKVEILVPENFAAAAQVAIEKGSAFARTQLEIFDLVNAPANKKTPQTLAEWAVRSGERHGYSVKVFEKAEIEALGLHALLAVNRGSENPPTFIVMEYLPKGVEPVKKIGLVGKGVTFDTGGLSIKPSANMHYMKTDMGGAAAVMGTVEMAAKLQLPVHLVAAVPATENSVDAKSIRPGDVIGSYAGKTIEVIDTDAEGRLILADGLSYLNKNFQPDVLLDLATLTGSCIRTLGYYAGGLFSNNDDLVSQILKASDATGERLWRLPLWDDYKKEIKSDVADVKNFSGNPSAGAITAAKFLELFTGNHPAWAHMDIAGVAVADSEFSSQKSATGFGVRLLITYLESFSASSQT